jgi:hypothetical protein
VRTSPGRVFRCSLSNGKSLSGSLLLGESRNRLVGLGDLSASLGAVELDVAVRRDVRGDATMGAVSSSATGDGALDSDVGDHALLWVKSLGLSVALEVDQKLADGLDGLLGPSAVAPLVLSNLSVSGDMLVEATEGNNLLMGEDSFHVLNSLSDFHAFNVSCSFVGVLKVRSQIRNFGFGGCEFSQSG